LRTLGMQGEAAFANYHHLLSRSKFDMLKGVKILIEMLLPLAGYAINNERGLIAESTAWYKKTHLTFSDLLEAVRQKIGSPASIVNSVLQAEFTNASTQQELPRDFAFAEGF